MAELVAPLAMRVRITRTDTPAQVQLLERKWIITPTDATGELFLPFNIPPSVPPGLEITVQWLCQDVTTFYGKTLTDGRRGTTP